MKALLLSVLAAAALAACAAPDLATDAQGARAEREYRTGSHLPSDRNAAGSGVQSASKEDVDKALDGSLNPGRTMPMPRQGGK